MEKLNSAVLNGDRDFFAVEIDFIMAAIQTEFDRPSCYRKKPEYWASGVGLFKYIYDQARKDGVKCKEWDGIFSRRYPESN